MITFAELATRVEQLEKRLEIIESQISNNSTNQNVQNGNINQSNLIESNMIDNITISENSYFDKANTSFSQNDLPENPLDDFTFCEVFGGIEITQYNGFDKDNIVIPKMIYNQPVVSIGENAFEGVSAKAVYLPDSIKIIKAEAFSCCSDLRYVKLQEGLQEIGEEAFYYCTSLNKIDLPESLMTLGESCFCNIALEQIVLPSNLEIVPLNCFAECKHLRKVLIKDGVLHIKAYAFEETAIKNIIIPQSVKTIGNRAFDSINEWELDIVFLGTETIVESSYDMNRWNGGSGKPTVYCKAGSAVQKIARKCGCTIKPLSEFQNL